MWPYLAVLGIHAGLLGLLAWWHLRAYRKAARASRHRVERMLAADTTDALRREIELLRHRNEVLMHGLYPRGEVFPGAFIEEDPELRALLDLLDLARRGELAIRPRQTDDTPAVPEPSP